MWSHLSFSRPHFLHPLRGMRKYNIYSSKPGSGYQGSGSSTISSLHNSREDVIDAPQELPGLVFLGMSIFFDAVIKIETFLESVISQDTSLDVHLGNYMTV